MQVKQFDPSALEGRNVEVGCGKRLFRRRGQFSSLDSVVRAFRVFSDLKTY